MGITEVSNAYLEHTWSKIGAGLEHAQKVALILVMIEWLEQTWSMLRVGSEHAQDAAPTLMMIEWLEQAPSMLGRPLQLR